LPIYPPTCPAITPAALPSLPSLPQAFFAQIYSEAQSAQAAHGHYALAELHQLRKLQRHYTMNIDGLAEVVRRPRCPWSLCADVEAGQLLGLGLPRATASRTGIGLWVAAS
jgi:hypothetical protein